MGGRALVALLAACTFLSTTNSLANSAEQKGPTWEELVLKGTEYRERSRYAPARKYYDSALRVQEKQKIEDIRRALVLHDIAETYRAETKWHEARVNDMLAHSIYAREIKDKQLGYEYSSKKPVSVHGGSLRPACYICHENWKVVPILYGESTGYDGETPEESDWKFTHKPGGAQIGDQRWYCRECQQSF